VDWSSSTHLRHSGIYTSCSVDWPRDAQVSIELHLQMWAATQCWLLPWLPDTADPSDAAMSSRLSQQAAASRFLAAWTGLLQKSVTLTFVQHFLHLENNYPLWRTVCESQKPLQLQNRRQNIRRRSMQFWDDMTQRQNRRQNIHLRRRSMHN